MRLTHISDMPRLIVVAGDTFPVLWIADYKAVIAAMLIDKFALIGFKEALAGIIFYIDINAEACFVLACTRLCGNAVVIGVIYLL